MKRNKLGILIIFVVAVGALTLAVGAPRIETARALPPRNPTPTPITPLPPPQTDYSKVRVNDGAHIELRADESQGLWAVVQWQDSAGNWRDVEGWRGNITTGSVVWWVSPRDFGEGPFRWAVYRGQGGASLTFSDSFDLPSSAGQTTRIDVSLAP